MLRPRGLALTAATLVLAACSTLQPPSVPAKAEQKLAPEPAKLLYTTFQDHAVIQRDKPIPVWGQATPGATVEVSFAGQTATATVDPQGHWRVVLPAMKAGGPYTLSATSSSGGSQTLTDILLGDIYLCSGQSNMELPLRLATGYDAELLGAWNPNLRLFHIQRFAGFTPQGRFGAGAIWSRTTPDTAKEFSAVCYYFGNDVQAAAGVPVGLIESAWSGSAIQAWIAKDKLASLGNYRDVLDIMKTYLANPKEGDDRYRALVHRWFAANDPAMTADPPWYAPALNDRAWDEARLTGGWRSWPKLPPGYGTIWWRKTVDLTAAEAQGQATLTLGPITDFDLTFVNGTEVGAGEAFDVVRKYTVPAGTLHAGKNIITVATVMGGGFIDPAEKMGLKPENGSVKALTGPWKWKASVPSNRLSQVPHQPWVSEFGLSTLYNGMIAPLKDTQIRGVVWYQGEADASQPAEYRRLLKALIEDWRDKFGANLPFYIVQLPGFGAPVTKPGQSSWAELRESQRFVADTTPDTGLAVTTDLGVPDNIHPQMKQEVGRRLALLARQHIYRQTVESHSPAPVSVIRRGRTVTVTFDHVGAGLQAREWNKAVGFQICTAPNVCHYADGVLTGPNAIKLDGSHDPKATTVRFCWSDSPWCNLYSAEGLPAEPFEMAIQNSRPARHLWRAARDK